MPQSVLVPKCPKVPKPQSAPVCKVSSAKVPHSQSAQFPSSTFFHTLQLGDLLFFDLLIPIPHGHWTSLTKGKPLPCQKGTGDCKAPQWHSWKSIHPKVPTPPNAAKKRMVPGPLVHSQQGPILTDGHRPATNEHHAKLKSNTMPCLSGNHWSSQASLSWKLSFKSWNFVARNCAIKIQEQWCCWGRPEWKQCPNKKVPQPTVPQPRVPNGPTSVPRISTWASSSWCAICCSLNYFVLKTRWPRNGLNQETFPRTVPPPFHLYLDPHQLDRGRTLVWMVSNLFQHVSKARVLISYTFSRFSSQWPPYEANSANHKFKVPTHNRCPVPKVPNARVPKFIQDTLQLQLWLDLASLVILRKSIKLECFPKNGSPMIPGTLQL